jgi:mono/diheme cytochrome c family protein
VSTDRGTPAWEDLEAVIRRGLPGTSMPAFDRLPPDQRRLLAEEVRRLHRNGVRQQYLDLLRNEGETIDEKEVAEFVDLRTAPGETIRPPEFGPADPEAVARGRKLYLQQNCQSCHGDDGAGASDVALFDDQRRPTLPRDLVQDPFKGGSEPEAIYRRLVLGMPGSPHPASSNLTADEFVDLVHYTRSLGQEPKRILTNHQRALLATQPRSDKGMATTKRRSAS